MNLYKIGLDPEFTPDDLVFSLDNENLSSWALLPGGIFMLNGSPVEHPTVIVPFEGELYLMTSVSDFLLSVNGREGSIDVRVTTLDCSDKGTDGGVSIPTHDKESSGLTSGLLPGVIAGAIGSYLLFNKG